MITPSSEDPEVAFFRDLAQAFVERRGPPMFISNKDWVLLAQLRKRGVPTRIVLRGIKDAFDAHAHSFSRKQKIPSLSFCAPEIKAAADRYRRALLADDPSGRGLASAIQALEARLCASPKAEEMAATLGDVRRNLAAIAKSVNENPGFDADAALCGAEDQLVQAASTLLGAQELARLDETTREATAAYKSRMPKNVYETLIGASVRRKVLQRFGLPRFLLAEIE